MGNKSKDKKEKNQTKDLSDMQENNSTKSELFKKVDKIIAKITNE